jgi:spermidine synthase
MLELVIGSSAVSLAILLATFMGGTCLGSLLSPRYIPSRSQPLRVYALIELGIAMCGLLVLLLMASIGHVYSAGFLLRGLVAAACLLLPTLLMGATLPTLARLITDVSWRGAFYTANIGGAVVGCLLAGFYLLREYDTFTATYVAGAINATVAVLAVVINHEDTKARRQDSSFVPLCLGGSKAVYVAIALSGLCALAGESIWTRMLGLLLGASTYTLSIIVAVFLVGLGIGSTIGSLLTRVAERPRLALGWCQLLNAIAIGWTAYSLGASLPFWPVNPSMSSDIWFNFQLDLDRAFWALLPPTIIWGASFPLAIAAVGMRDSDDAGRLMAKVYAANTFGAIVGALVTNLLLIRWLGSQRVQQGMIGISLGAGLLVMLPAVHRRSRISLGIVAAASAALFIYSVPPLAKILVAHGRYASTWVGKGDVVYAREGLNSSVAVSDFPNGVRTFHVAGKIQASNVPRDMRLQRMLGHLTTLTPAHARSVLVIGCGAGITAGAVSIDPAVERVTIVEIEPIVPDTAASYFGKENFDVIHSSKTKVHIDDGRHYLQTTSEHFDAITADPLDPWVKGAANLYTKEFLEIAKQHLNPGGVVTMYIQLFETNADAVKSAMATFFEVFPNGTVWGNTYEGRGHDMLLLGQVEPQKIDLERMNQRLAQTDYMQLTQSLSEVGMQSPVDLFATYAGRANDLMQWLNGAAINRDRNLRMQYLAGTALNLDESAEIYSEMLAYRRFPDDLFIGQPEQIESLKLALQ